MADPKNSRLYERYPRLTLLLIAFAGIVMALIGAELISRYFIPQWAPVTAERAKFWQFDDLLGWSQIPNQKGAFQHPDFSTWVEINSRGLRDREYSLERNEKKRMLVLGDSYGWGFGVNNDQVFTELMEARHPDWEIINASVSGYGTVQQYLYLAQRGLLFKPDVVLLLFNDNDFQDNVGLTEYWYNKPVVALQDNHYEISGLPVAPQNLRQQMDVFFLGNFYIARGLYSSLQIPVDIISTLISPSAAPPAVKIDSLDATAYVLEKMIALNQSQHIQTVIVQTPLSDIKHQTIEIQCDKFHITCFHLKQVFNVGKKIQWHFEHDHHWNATGHRMAADAIDDFLAKKQLWDNPKGLVF
jgi:hypothetical protein